VAEQGVRERWVWREGGEGLKGPGFEFSLPILLALDGIDQLLANGPGPLILGSDCQGFQNPQGSGVGSVGVRVGVGISNP